MNAPFLLLACLSLAGCSHPGAKLPKYAQVPAFTMTDEDGNTFHSSQLSGKVWVADFIYTTCPAECPMMTAKMKRLSLQTSPGVQLVSFSIDPDHDTPAALKTFASHYDAHWTFLTGTSETIHVLAYNTFHIGDVLGKMEHSTKFALVDQQGTIRGYYSSLGEEGIPALLHDSEALRQN